MGVPVIEKNQDRAFYSPKDDCITIPPRKKFISDKAYYIDKSSLCFNTLRLINSWLSRADLQMLSSAFFLSEKWLAQPSKSHLYR
jgi:antirestriction protein ArdC